MIDFLWTCVYYFGVVSIWICLILVALKIIWNLGLPYAMMKETARSWSIFPLIEIVPLVMAFVISLLTQQNDSLTPVQLLIWGFGAIIASYIHLAIVSFLYGVMKWRNGKRSTRSNK
jgi:hypothetical protein